MEKQENSKAVKKINKFVSWLDMKKISIITVLVFVISMLPIWYLAFYARPSGDDYGYSINTHRAWLRTHSLIEVFKAGLVTTKSMCNTWNGDWFTVFLFTLMPEVFVTYSFWVVPLFMTGIVIAGTICLAHEILVKRLNFQWYESLMAASLVLIASYQFIPSTAIGMYWYVGATHYMLPHAIALFLLVFLSKFERTGKVRYIVYSAIGTIMTGGSSYFSTLLVFLIYFAVVLLCVKKRRIWLLGIPFVTGSIALFFQIMAPGNAKRGGTGFGFSFAKIVETILQSLIQAVVSIGEYMKDKTFLFIVLIVLAVLVWECLHRAEPNFQFRLPGLFVFYMYGIYAAMFTPEIYAAVDVSLGPATMQYVTFLLAAGACIIYVEGWLICRLKSRQRGNVIFDSVRYRKRVMLPVVCICAVLVILNRGMFSDSVFNRSYEYVASGQAEDFKAQIASQMEILLDDSIKEAYLCPINDQQGPLMHMPVTEDPEAFTNRVVAGFYQKDKVIMEKRE